MRKGNVVHDWLQTYNSDRINKKGIVIRFCEWLGKTSEETIFPY